MHLLQPFAAMRPKENLAAQVIAPPYDVLTRKQAWQLAENNPVSILHVTKPEIHFPDDFDHTAEIYRQGARNLVNLRKQEIFISDPHPRYYVYRMQTAEHSQTGIVAMASVAAYETQRIRRHELTRPAKVNDRQQLLDAVKAQVSPVLLTYRDNDNIDPVLAQLTEATPLYDVTAQDGVIHQIWPITSNDLIIHLTEAFDQMQRVYIADGHHRTQAAVQHAKQTAAQDPDQYFLSVLFPASQMRILGYHRVLRDLNGHTPQTVLKLLTEKFTVSPLAEPVLPIATKTFGLYLNQQWYLLSAKESATDPTDPIANLDVSLLHQTIIEPLFAVSDPTTDDRIDFIGGHVATETIEQLVDSGVMQAGFTLYPTQIEQLFAVADANQIMPPKSTWFDPKLVDGLLNFAT